MSDDLVKRLRKFDWVLHELEIVDQAADRIEKLAATNEELEGKLAELLVVVKRAVRLSLDHSDFKLYAMEPLERAIAAAELKGQDNE